MKNILTFLTVGLIFALTACQPKQVTEPVDKQAIEKEVASFLDDLLTVYETRDFDSFAAKLNDDGLFLGSDKKEIWTKTDILNMFREMYQNPEFTFTYTLSKRFIRVADDGKSALVVEQMEGTPIFGPFPVRVTSAVKKSENGWKVDYMGWGVIPDNEDLFKCIDVLGK